MPSAVANEVPPRTPLPAWIQIRTLVSTTNLQFPEHFGAGEREAIVLALQLHNCQLVVDDRPARRFAAQLGIAVVGTAGVLGLAKAGALIPKLKPYLDALRAADFRHSDEIYVALLRDAGEL